MNSAHQENTRLIYYTAISVRSLCPQDSKKSFLQHHHYHHYCRCWSLQLLCCCCFCRSHHVHMGLHPNSWRFRHWAHSLTRPLTTCSYASMHQIKMYTEAYCSISFQVECGVVMIIISHQYNWHIEQAWWQNLISHRMPQSYHHIIVISDSIRVSLECAFCITIPFARLTFIVIFHTHTVKTLVSLHNQL